MKRDIAIDYLRSGVTVLVVAHHAALAYNTFSRYDTGRYMKSTHPIVDAARFMPLDILVGWNDLFFMALMFLISGLFVAPSLERKGAARFLVDRTKRLGIPFIVAAVVLGPLSYFPSWLMSDSAGKGDFVFRFFTIDEGSAGPAWFIWVLLLFCAAAATVYRFVPGLLRTWSWCPRSAGRLVIPFLAVSLIAIIPLHLAAPGEWFRVAGPVSFPAQRWLLYFTWFTLGIALGGAGTERSLTRANLRPWPLWLAVGMAGYLVHATLTTGKYLGGLSADGTKLLLGTAYAFCCTFTSLGAAGLARSCVRGEWAAADNFSGNAYGVYIFHYTFVTWLQFGLLGLSLPPGVKFSIVFVVALAAGWFLTALLRRTAAGRVL